MLLGQLWTQSCWGLVGRKAMHSELEGVRRGVDEADIISLLILAPLGRD